jgi:hypothetical protein
MNPPPGSGSAAEMNGNRPESSREANPRATAVAAGYLFASIGLVFSFGACCFWSLSSRIVEPAHAPPTHWLEYFSGERLPAAVLTIGVVSTLVGGFGLVGVGVGLQGEKPGSGTAASVLTGALACIYGACTTALIVRGDVWLQAIVPLVFALLATAMFALALHAAAVLRRYPPPKDQHAVTDDMLKSMHRRR